MSEYNSYLRKMIEQDCELCQRNGEIPVAMLGLSPVEANKFKRIDICSKYEPCPLCDGKGFLSILQKESE